MLKITHDIKKIEKTFTQFFMSKSRSDHFDIDGITRTTISILGALTTLTHFSENHKNELSNYNKNYINLIEDINIKKDLNSSVKSILSFYDHSLESFDLKKYRFLSNLYIIDLISKKILKKIRFKKIMNKDFLFLKNLIHFVVIKYLLDHELNSLDLYVSKVFNERKDINELLSFEFENHFKNEISLLIGRNIGRFFVENCISDIHEELWCTFRCSEKCVFSDLSFISDIINNDEINVFVNYFIDKYTNISNSEKVKDNFYNCTILIFKQIFLEK